MYRLLDLCDNMKNTIGMLQRMADDLGKAIEESRQVREGVEFTDKEQEQIERDNELYDKYNTGEETE